MMCLRHVWLIQVEIVLLLNVNVLTVSLKLDDKHLPQSYLHILNASVGCLKANGGRHLGLDVSKNKAQGDCGFAKTGQEKHRDHLAYMDYERHVVNSKAGVLNQTYMHGMRAVLLMADTALMR